LGAKLPLKEVLGTVTLRRVAAAEFSPAFLRANTYLTHMTFSRGAAKDR
jgi:hypothetical protein